jgi:hypothetical protein
LAPTASAINHLRANPPVRDRLAAVQALLENGKGEIRLRISHTCKRMIECLELQCYTEKGDPDKDAGHDHMNDALGYVIWREFNPLHAGAGRSTGIRLYKAILTKHSNPIPNADRI